MKDLIAKLEAATEGSRELDDAINRATGDKHLSYDPPHYTTSIDAALTLVPKEFRWWSLSNKDNEDEFFIITLREPYAGGRYRHCAGAHLTVALALCIVALKARDE